MTCSLDANCELYLHWVVASVWGSDMWDFCHLGYGGIGFSVGKYWVGDEVIRNVIKSTVNTRKFLSRVLNAHWCKVCGSLPCANDVVTLLYVLFLVLSISAELPSLNFADNSGYWMKDGIVSSR